MDRKPPTNKILTPLKNLTEEKKYIYFDPPINFFLSMAMVILSASVKIFSVSRMRDFFLLFSQFVHF